MQDKNMVCRKKYMERHRKKYMGGHKLEATLGGEVFTHFSWGGGPAGKYSVWEKSNWISTRVGVGVLRPSEIIGLMQKY